MTTKTAQIFDQTKECETTPSNVPGNGATKWVTAPEDYDYVYNYLKVVRDNFVNILCSN